MVEPGGISLDEFKARLPLAEIVGRHVRLVRRGREWQGLCPFHQEKTPSFTVSEEKGFYHCFGCGQHGNGIDFVMAIEGLDFSQAVTRLAELSGLPAPLRQGGRMPAVDKSLVAANEAAARWFQGRLESPAGREAAAYLKRRGLDAGTIARFGLGYAPGERQALRHALVAEGFAEDKLIEAGLLIRTEDGGRPFDRFRHRVMFPIHDRQGKVVAFGGRALGDAKAKYLNTPETPLFHKGELLYGLALARTAARAKGTVVVAEGYMDVIALARAGFEHAVAPLGTAITETQLALLWQLADEPTICLDGDAAGLRAGHRLVEHALPHLKPGKSLRFAILPEGADPDDLIRDGGAESLAFRLEEALSLFDFLWDSETRNRNADTPERQAALRQRLGDLTQSIQDRAVRNLFRQAITQSWRARFGGWSGRRQNSQKAPGAPAYLAPESGGRGVGGSRLGARLANPDAAIERELLAPLLAHPELLQNVEEELGALEFADSTLENLRQEIISWYSDVEHLDQSGLSNHLTSNGFASLVEQMSRANPWTAWYSRENMGKADVLAGWRARVERHRGLSDRRASRDALADAIMAASEDETKVRVLTIDRLFNAKLTKTSDSE
jgi:DNA primase